MNHGFCQEWKKLDKHWRSNDKDSFKSGLSKLQQEVRLGTYTDLDQFRDRILKLDTSSVAFEREFRVLSDQILYECKPFINKLVKKVMDRSNTNPPFKNGAGSSPYGGTSEPKDEDM